VSSLIHSVAKKYIHLIALYTIAFWHWHLCFHWHCYYVYQGYQGCR